MFSERLPTPVKKPTTILLNKNLCKMLGLNPMYLTPDYLSGNTIPESTTPIAQAYAGHQFGHFTILGDGRAILIGEQLVDDILYDIQLKGPGRTRYSRSGDGRATLSSMLREYIISEAMYHLNIPTTRSLAVVETGETVLREQPNKGAILARVSKAHIRVGTFQFAALKEMNHVKALADYTIERLHPSCKDGENPYIELLETVINKQAELIAKWQSVGFIHGVMNTDNMSIACESIDYGPCAFMDTYHAKTVFSSIDSGGRYSYENQPNLAQWNLARFAETLMPLFDPDKKKALLIAQTLIESYTSKYKNHWLRLFSSKIGLTYHDESLINELLTLMERYKLDFTNTFRALSENDFHNDKLEDWLIKWNKEIIDYDMMKQYNPTTIPRNHKVDEALKAAEQSNYKPLKALLLATSSPFDYNEVSDEFTLAPLKHEEILKTYCGT
jgi:uncharacterized protein YdiU (UPF0061 family)